MVEQINHASKGVKRPESYDLRVVNIAKPLWNKTKDLSLVSEGFEFGNVLTLQKLAKKAHSDFIEFEVSKMVKGIVEVDGKEVPVLSQNIDEPKIVFFVKNGNGKREIFMEGDWHSCSHKKI